METVIIVLSNAFRLLFLYELLIHIIIHKNTG